MPAQTAAAHMGHDRHAGHSVAMFRDKFWLTLTLTLPVVLWSVDVQHWLGYTAPTFPGTQYIPAFLGTVIFLYGGSVFIRGLGENSRTAGPGEEPRLLRIADAAKYLSATTWQIETLLREKTIPSFVIGKRRVVDHLELDRYVETRNTEAKAALETSQL